MARSPGGVDAPFVDVTHRPDSYALSIISTIYLMNNKSTGFSVLYIYEMVGSGLLWI